MGSFASKYLALAALLSIVAQAAQKMAAQGESLVQKLEGEVVLVPGVLGFISSGKAGMLGAELQQIKSSPEDEVAAVEYLVNELAFSSDKAKAILPLAYAEAEALAALVAPTKALVAAL